MFETTNQVSLFHHLKKNKSWDAHIDVSTGFDEQTHGVEIPIKCLARKPGECAIFSWEVPVPGYPNHMFYQKNVEVLFFWGFPDVTKLPSGLIHKTRSTCPAARPNARVPHLCLSVWKYMRRHAWAGCFCQKHDKIIKGSGLV